MPKPTSTPRGRRQLYKLRGKSSRAEIYAVKRKEDDHAPLAYKVLSKYDLAVATGKKPAHTVEVLDDKNRKSPTLAFSVARKANDGDRLKTVAERLQVSSPQLLSWLNEVAAHCPREEAAETEALTDREKIALLSADGGLQNTPLDTWAYIRTAIHFWELTRNSLSINEAARHLSAGADEITNRIDQRTLYGFQVTGQNIMLPDFQFTTTGTLTGLESIIPEIPIDTHPLGVVGFFNHSNSDITILDNAVSPIIWLLSGHPVEPVVALARALEYYP